MRRLLVVARCGVSVLACLLVAAPVYGVVILPTGPTLEFQTEILSMALTGGPVPVPLASDPGNALGDSVDGYGFVQTQVAVGLSGQHRSLGGATATPPLAPGQPYNVDSFFDIFFDVTLTDVDPGTGRNFAGQADGATLTFSDLGPVHIEGHYTAFLDPGGPLVGLFQTNPYIGAFNVEVPLGIDVNGNGENDKIKFSLTDFSVLGANQTFIVLPDGTVLSTFSMSAFLNGAVVDVSTDPPFSITLTGPTTASSRLDGASGAVPEPTTLAGLALGLAVLSRRARRKRA